MHAECDQVRAVQRGGVARRERFEGFLERRVSMLSLVWVDGRGIYLGHCRVPRKRTAVVVVAVQR